MSMTLTVSSLGIEQPGQASDEAGVTEVAPVKPVKAAAKPVAKGKATKAKQVQATTAPEEVVAEEVEVAAAPRQGSSSGSEKKAEQVSRQQVAESQ